ncbi:MAG: Acg family FMN-binding oxidoreductase [Rhodococcus sp. (in: high G+C Gram-positive bacteria)]
MKRIVSITLGSVAGVAVFGLAVILVLGGIFVPAHYLDPWSSEYSDRFDDPRMKVVARAELAPSSHNTQPWFVSLDPSDPQALYLFTDATRLTPAVDPLSRQAMVSQGTFLQYLKTAAADMGYQATIDLFPAGPYDEANLMQSMIDTPVAKVALTEDSSVATDDAGSLFRSDTNRAPYEDTPLTTAQIVELTDSAPESGATIQMFTDAENKATLTELAVIGTLIESGYAPATDESTALFHPNEGSKNDARSGFAVEGQGTSGFMKYFLQGLITIMPSINDDAATAKNAISSTDEAVTHTPAYALVSTASNSRTEQVQAGMVYAELSLRARTLGLVMQPLSQVLQEYPDMAEPYEAIHDKFASQGQTIQMMVRIGSPTTEYPTTMRRDVTTLIRTP